VLNTINQSESVKHNKSNQINQLIFHAFSSLYYNNLRVFL